MHVQSMTTFINPVQPGVPRRSLARLIIAAIGLLTCAVAGAQLPVQQLTVAFTNAYPNGSVDALTMPNSAAKIGATDPLLTNGTTQNLYTALTWVTNPATGTLDLIFADAQQHRISRLPGPTYNSPQVIFLWSAKTPGPPYPVGLAADPSGNVYVISPNSAWGKPGVWVLPFDASVKTYYDSPLLIDSTFDAPGTNKPVSTLALTEVAVPASAASGGSPAWGALDLLVLIADPSNTRVIRYQQQQIKNLLISKTPLQGPYSTVVMPAQFLTQVSNKIAPIPVGMDIGQDPTTQDSTLLLATVDGRILDFDATKNVFITPYATNLGLGLTRVKVGTFQGVQYVFAAQLPGQILEFQSPAAGSSNKTPFASVSKGVSNPSDLAVTYSGTTAIGGPSGACIKTACNILPQVALQFTGPGTSTIPATSASVDSCTVVDSRVPVGGGVPNSFTPLPLSPLCAILPPNVFLSANVFGASGPNQNELYIGKITAAALSTYQNNTTPINNTLTQFMLNPGTIFPINPGCPYGPVVAWGPLPGFESTTPETLAVAGAASVVSDITVDCASDPPPGGNSNHPSIFVEGTVLAGAGQSAGPSYIDGEFGYLQTALNNMVMPPVGPPNGPSTQIVDPTGQVVPTIREYITNSQTFFMQQNYSCALNSLWNGAQYINNTVPPGDFIAGPPPSDDENPRGNLLSRFDHVYHDVDVYTGVIITPVTYDALTLPMAMVPACGATISNFTVVNSSDTAPTFDGTGFDLLDNTTYDLVWTTTNVPEEPGCTLTTTDGLFTNQAVPMSSAYGSSPISYSDPNASNGYQTATLTCGTAMSSFEYIVNPPPPPPAISGFTVVTNSDASPPTDDAGFDLTQAVTYYLVWTTSGMPAGAACTLTTLDGSYTNQAEPLNSAFSGGSSPAPFTDSTLPEGEQKATLTCGVAPNNTVSQSFSYLVETPPPPAPMITNFTVITDDNNTPGNDVNGGISLSVGAEPYYLVWSTTNATACSLSTTDSYFTNAAEPTSSAFMYNSGDSGAGTSPVVFSPPQTSPAGVNPIEQTATLTCGTASKSFQYSVGP
jgi:hypothetical protein